NAKSPWGCGSSYTMGRTMRLGLLSLGMVTALAGTPAGADAPPDPAAPDVQFRLEGSEWSGVDSDGDHYTFRYLKGGILSYTSPTGTFPKGGTWRQDGAAADMAINGPYPVYPAPIPGQ